MREEPDNRSRDPDFPLPHHSAFKKSAVNYAWSPILSLGRRFAGNTLIYKLLVDEKHASQIINHGLSGQRMWAKKWIPQKTEPFVPLQLDEKPVPHSLRAGALACNDATPGAFCALFRCYLMTDHF